MSESWAKALDRTRAAIPRAGRAMISETLPNDYRKRDGRLGMGRLRR